MRDDFPRQPPPSQDFALPSRPTLLSYGTPLGSGLMVGQQILILSGEGSNPSSPTTQSRHRGVAPETA